MQNQEANTQIEKIVKAAEKGKFDEKLIVLLKALRPYALAENDPLLTRSIRLCYEFIAATEGFDITMPEDAEIEGDDAEKFLYICGLWQKSENKYNRDELREIADAITNTY